MEVTMNPLIDQLTNLPPLSQTRVLIWLAQAAEGNPSIKAELIAAINSVTKP
jgi:hypothetical protein